jgi:ABC-type antimicrobial peptide transport system ATPase subunit
MRLKPERQEAYGKLFGRPMSLTVVVTDIENQVFKKLPEGETFLQHWTKLFGDKGKQEAIALLKRVIRKKQYDLKVFSQTFGQRIYGSH